MTRQKSFKLVARAPRRPQVAARGRRLRCLIIAAVVAGLASQAEIDGWDGGLLLGLALWIGFPFVLWIGAMVHESTPWKLAAIDAGDWLVKLSIVAVIVSVGSELRATRIHGSRLS